MKKNLWASFLAIFFLALLSTSCTDPLDVGSELLEEDRARVGFSDTLKLVMQTEIGDSVRAFFPGINPIRSFLFGRTQDAYFGTTAGEIYMETLLSRDLGGNFIPFAVSSSAVLDSVVLVLPIDSTGIYGMVDGTFGMEVYEVTERIDVPEDDNGEINFYSNVTFAVNPVPLATTSFIPNYTDSAFVSRSINASSLDTVDLKSPHVRIRLDDMFGQQFLNQDSLTYQNDSTLLDFFRGFYLKPTGTTSGLMNLAINKAWAGLYFYFRDGQDTLTYNLATGIVGRRVSAYRHDYTGSLAGAFLENPSDQDSLVFLQGLQGLITSLKIPNINTFAGKVINKAELELQVAVFPDYDFDFNPPVNQIIALKRNDDGDLVAISDVSVVPNDLSFYFGGQPQLQPDGSYSYSLNLSIQTQYVIDGSEPETIYLAVFPRPANANRVILKGPGAIENPAILKVSFTDL
jgi:hypothetical protein